ncbi:MAG: IS5 family transposase [Sphingobacteriaceae bacterium]|nr:IS5 family transposase [Sphingobacteriaceae bacterium]
MLAKKPVDKGLNLFYSSLSVMLNQKHPLFILSHQINWPVFEEAFSGLYCLDNGRPAKPIRLMVGLLILKHLRSVSDESVVEQWGENAYYQYFCGQQDFMPAAPCEASDLVHFRKRIGESGAELILKESIRINGKDSGEDQVSIDSTVQEKNITYPTDAKLHRKIISKCKAISRKEGLILRQSYTFVLKKLGMDQRFRHHPKNKGKARKADKKVKTIAGRLVRELERNLGENKSHHAKIELFNRVLTQKKGDKNKIYSLHEPEVHCISKGKEHKKFEFGNKVSIIYTQNTGVIVGAASFRNEYDGHTLEIALNQHEKLTGKRAGTAIADRGYRGKTMIGGTVISIPKPFNDKKLSKYKQIKMRKAFRRRAAIEPCIGHLKADHRLGRNFYKGIVGDSINLMLAAAAYNFKRMINKWKSSLLGFILNCFRWLQWQYKMMGWMIYHLVSGNINYKNTGN